MEEFQQQIKDKTQMMDSSNVRVSDLSKFPLRAPTCHRCRRL